MEILNETKRLNVIKQLEEKCQEEKRRKDKKKEKKKKS
jgi:hypothetical protein